MRRPSAASRTALVIAFVMAAIVLGVVVFGQSRPTSPDMQVEVAPPPAAVSR